MASVLDVIRVGTEVYGIYSDYQKREIGSPGINKVSLAAKSCLVGINVIAMGAAYKGAQLGTLATIKKVETFLRLCDLPIEYSKVKGRSHSVLEIFEKGILAPLMAGVRAHEEAGLYEAKDLSAIPIYECDSHLEGSCRKIGMRNLNVEELKQFEVDASFRIAAFKIAEIVFTAGALNKLRSMIESTNKIDFKVLGPNGENFPRCAITNMPIRKLMVPNTPSKVKTFYDKASIDAWIQEKPMTAPPGWPLDKVPLPLTPNSIKPGSFSIQAYIDDEWKKVKQ